MRNAIARLFPMNLVLTILAAAQVAQASGDEILGRYWLPDHNGQFEITMINDSYFGRVIAYDVEDQLDSENADPSLRSRRFLGIHMFEGFSFNSREGKWTSGTIYDATNGKTYDCTMWFNESEPNTLVARGYIGFSFLGRNTSFDRVLTK